MTHLLFASMLLITVPQQEADSTLTLEAVVALALEHNYDIRLERNNLRVAENNNTLGNAGFMPSVELRGSAQQSVQDTDISFANGESQVRDAATTTNYNAAANLSWTIFDGLRMFTTKARLEEMQRSNQLAYRAQVQNTVADVMKAFYNTVLEQERLALLQSTLQLSDERVKISKDKYEVGKASKLEYLQAQVDYNTDRSALVKQKEVIANSKFMLMQFLAKETGSVDFALRYSYDLDPFLSLEQVEQEAIANNPNLAYLRSNREVALLSTLELERARLPALDFNMGYTFSQMNAEAGFVESNRGNGVNYGLTATMTLFDGMNQTRSIQNARVQAETTQIAYEQARTQLTTSLHSAYLTFQNSKELAQLEQENLEVAHENEEIALERYRIGKSGPLELREAQNNAVNAEIRYLEALNTAKIAEIELLRLSGQLISNRP